MKKILHHISPTYTHEKLVTPSYTDLIDVFEDRMRRWFLEPILHLISIEHGNVPAFSLALGYFEGIEIYYSGQDSKGASKKFFRRGFRRTYRIKQENSSLHDRLIDGLYEQARCGVAHDGMFRNRVFFSEARSEAITFTWPKKDGEFDKDGHLESVIVNVPRFVEGIIKNFEQYVDELRSESDPEKKSNFLAIVALKWGLGEPEISIGMTEAEFFGRHENDLS